MLCRQSYEIVVIVGIRPETNAARLEGGHQSKHDPAPARACRFSEQVFLELASILNLNAVLTEAMNMDGARRRAGELLQIELISVCTSFA